MNYSGGHNPQAGLETVLRIQCVKLCTLILSPFLHKFRSRRACSATTFYFQLLLSLLFEEDESTACRVKAFSRYICGWGAWFADRYRGLVSEDRWQGKSSLQRNQQFDERSREAGYYNNERHSTERIKDNLGSRSRGHMTSRHLQADRQQNDLRHPAQNRSRSRSREKMKQPQKPLNTP